jgi:hypothetical protein
MIECPTIPERRESGVASHRWPLKDGRWALWRTLAVRGAGFPAADVLKLGDSMCGIAADSVLEAEAEVQRARSVILERLRRDLKVARGPERRALDKIKRRVKQNQLSELAQVPEGQTWATDLFAASHRLELLTKEFQSAFNLALEKGSRAIREIAADERFQEAVIWQNRAAWHRGVEFLLRKDREVADQKFCERTSRVRDNEELIANYIQRYCVKNDSIGFFGPVGWATLANDGEVLTVRPGPFLIDSRCVFLESWGIDTLAATLAQNELLKPWLAPRQMPFVLHQQGTVFLPGGSSFRISDQEAMLLEACNGEDTARELAVQLLRRPDCTFKSKDEVYQGLESLCASGLIAWTLEVPLVTDGERNLRKLIGRIDDESLRQATLNTVSEMEVNRQAVADAAGDPKALDQALNNLDQTFIRLTGGEATRAAGQTYGGRTLVYEDCRRDIEIVFGPELMQALEPTLTMLLDSARWIIFQMGEKYRKILQELYTELVKKTGSRIVRGIDFWIKADRLNVKERADEVAAEFQKRWSELLSLPPGQTRVSYSSDQLQAGVKRVFAAPAPGWSAACHHSPDIMIAASDPEAIRRGDYQFVLGELHLGVNTLNTPVFGSRHPHPEEIHQAIESDIPNPRLVQVLPKHWPELTARTTNDFVSPRDFRLLLSHDSCGVPRSRAVPISSLVIEDSSDGLIVRTVDGRLSFDILEAFAQTLSARVINSFSLLPPTRHTPRVTIDRVVVCREAKRFSCTELGFAFEKDEAVRFLAAHRWMREQDLPRFMFVKSKLERKPFYVDMNSPILLNILAKIIRRTKDNQDTANSLITFTEMLPSHDETWLPDIEGNHYASELRMVAVDLTRLQDLSIN